MKDSDLIDDLCMQIKHSMETGRSFNQEGWVLYKLVERIRELEQEVAVYEQKEFNADLDVVRSQVRISESSSTTKRAPAIDYASSALFCEHSNDNPGGKCKCPIDCYCKNNACRKF